MLPIGLWPTTLILSATSCSFHYCYSISIMFICFLSLELHFSPMKGVYSWIKTWCFTQRILLQIHPLSPLWLYENNSRDDQSINSAGEPPNLITINIPGYTVVSILAVLHGPQATAIIISFFDNTLSKMQHQRTQNSLVIVKGIPEWFPCYSNMEESRKSLSLKIKN